MPSENILEVRDLSVDYASDTGTVHAVDDVSFVIRRGEVFGLAGESGSGKSTLAFALTRLLKFPARITGGQILFHGRADAEDAGQDWTSQDSVDILELESEELRQFRWNGALDRLSKRNECAQSGTRHPHPDHRRTGRP